MATPIITSIFLLLAITLHRTSGCSCFEPPTFCTGHFGIKGVVTATTQGTSNPSMPDVTVTFGTTQGYSYSTPHVTEFIYSVQVLEVYRNTLDDHDIQVNTNIDIQTPSDEGLCGIFLEKDVTYLISGEIYGGSYMMWHCLSVVIQYHDKGDLSSVGIPCSGSSTATPTPITTTPASPTTIPSSPTINPTSLTTLTTTITNTMSPPPSCLCDEEPVFCSSEFAIKGTIVNIQGNRTRNEDLIYSVQVQEIYRNSSNSGGIYVDEIINVQTPGNSCGIATLEMGSSYLISGGYTGSYSIDVCTSVVLQYNEVGDGLDIIPTCSASMTTITSYVVVAWALLQVIFHW